MDHSGPLRNYAVIGALSVVVFAVLAAQRAAQAAAAEVPLGIHKSRPFFLKEHASGLNSHALTLVEKQAQELAADATSLEGASGIGGEQAPAANHTLAPIPIPPAPQAPVDHLGVWETGPPHDLNRHLHEADAWDRVIDNFEDMGPGANQNSLRAAGHVLPHEHNEKEHRELGFKRTCKQTMGTIIDSKTQLSDFFGYSVDSVGGAVFTAVTDKAFVCFGCCQQHRLKAL